jgi:hypothetical protein
MDFVWQYRVNLESVLFGLPDEGCGAYYGYTNRRGICGKGFWWFFAGTSNCHYPVIAVGQAVLGPEGNEVRCKMDCDVMLLEPWDS